jgi:hypothetical protein
MVFALTYSKKICLLRLRICGAPPTLIKTSRDPGSLHALLYQGTGNSWGSPFTEYLDDFIHHSDLPRIKNKDFHILL